MNIYELLNSRSIAEYWEEIGYQPGSLETAWLIYNSKKLTFNRQCAYWQEIIDTMPDMTIGGRTGDPCGVSLHALLACYIKVCRNFAGWFSDGNGSIYTAADFYDEGAEAETLDAAFSSLEKVKFYALENTYSDVFIINKLPVDCGSEYVTARLWFNKSFEPVRPDKWSFGRFPCNEYEYDCFNLFEDMRFNFPVPFRKGDVVFNPDCVDIGLYVLSSPEADDTEDDSDKVFKCYYQGKDGRISATTIRDMTAFEYYRGEFCGKQRIMKALSNYEKGLIGTDLLLRAYHYILCREAQENELEVLSFVFEESTLDLAGINLHENDGLNLSHRQ